MGGLAGAVADKPHFGKVPQSFGKTAKAASRVRPQTAGQMHVSFYRPDAAGRFPFPTAFCKACPYAQHRGFCGARVQPECLHIDPAGTVRVVLSASPREWFGTIAHLGEVLHLARNSVGVLGRLGRAPAPMLGPGQDSLLPSDRAGAFRPNLAEYASLSAIRENSPVGTLYGLEARDAAGVAFERILLPLAADHARFKQFVISHQSPPEEAGSWFSPNHASGRRRRARLASRIPRLRSQWEAGERSIRRLPSRIVPKLLAAAARWKLPLRTTSFHRGLIRSVTWVPQTHGETPRADGALEFFQDDITSLHLDRRGVVTVWLWTGQCSCCSDTRWRIEVGDARESVGLSITAGTGVPDVEWRDLVRACLP